MRRVILVVEDEVLLRADLSDALRQHGYEVTEAPNASKAIELLESSLDVHLVCTDVRMPGPIDGVGLTNWIKANRQRIPVIIVSGESTARILPNAADVAMTKPVDMSVLLRHVELLLKRDQSRSGT